MKKLHQLVSPTSRRSARLWLKLLACCTLALLTANRSEAAPFLVYKIVTQKKLTFWKYDKETSLGQTGVLNTNLAAYVIQNVGDATQLAIYLDEKKKTYSVGGFGFEMSFIDPLGTDPFNPSVEVYRTTVSDSKGKDTEFWTFATNSDGEFIFDGDGQIVKNPFGDPLITTAKTGAVMNLTGKVTSIKMPNGDVLLAPTTRAGDGSSFVTDARHVVYGWNADTASGPVGLVQKYGALHAWETSKISHTYQAPLSKVANDTIALLDDAGQPISAGSERYAALAVIKSLIKSKFTAK